MVTVRTLSVALLAALFALACTGDDDDGADRSTTTSTTEATTSTTEPTDEPSGSSTSTTVDAAAVARELEPLLVEAPLAGFERADDERFGAGPLDLDAAAAIERDESAERAVLETRRFQAGYARAWTNPDGDVVLVTLYRFAEPAGAAAYLADGRENLLPRGAQEFDVPDVRGAFGFTQVDDTAEGAFTGHAVAFVRGDVHVLIIVGSTNSSRTPDDARAVAAAQDLRLRDA